MNNTLQPIPENPSDTFSDLREEAYAATLVSCAERAGLFSANDKTAMQAGLYALLCELAARASKGKSSSLRIERAEELLESAMFSVSMALKVELTPEDALKKLKRTQIRTLFAEGQKLIGRKILICRAMHKNLCKQLFDTPNVFYRSTVIDGITGFFKLYDPLFGGQILHITADYPTCLGRPGVCGIEFIESYLQRIRAENDFLRLFPAKNVHVFLKKLVPTYAETPMNLFEPVFCHAALLAALGKDPAELCAFDETDAAAARAFVSDTASLEKAFLGLLDGLNATESVRQYFELCKPDLMAAIKIQVRLAC